MTQAEGGTPSGQPAGRWLRSFWLQELARREDWPAFRAAWSPSIKSPALRCPCGLAISVPLTGWLTRRFGQVRLFTASVLLFVIASWLCGLAPNMATLITLLFTDANDQGGGVYQAVLEVDGAQMDRSLRALMKDAKSMASAKEIFATRCVPCHGPEGQGVIGPNLTDDYWIHGRSLVEIRRTISEGVPDTARAMVIVPVLLRTASEVEDLVERLEVTALGKGTARTVNVMR